MSSKWNKLIDQPIGSYKLIECIGRGGMAVVYKAHQPMLDRFVAIKFIADHLLEDPEATERTLREARAISRLEHPHILPIYDCGVYDQSPFIVMKYIKGPTLKEYIHLTRPGAKESCEILIQILEALELAHQRGIVHRDLKPSNILMEPNGWIYLSDFGIARSIHEDPTLTAAGMIMGTPEYMAPEQVRGTRADLRSDLYAAGILLFELLTGCLPFRADTPAGILLKQLEAPVPLQESDISPPLQQILGKALAKKPEDRFANAAEFRIAIEGAIKARTSVTVQLPMPARKRRWQAIAILGILLAAVVAVVFTKSNSVTDQKPTAIKQVPTQTAVQTTAPPKPSEVRREPDPEPVKAEPIPSPIPSTDQLPEPPPAEIADVKAAVFKALSSRVIQGRVTAVGDSQIEIQTKTPLQAGMAGIVVSRESKKPLARIHVMQADGSIGTAEIVKGERDSILLQDAAVILFPPEADGVPQRYRLLVKSRLKPVH